MKAQELEVQEFRKEESLELPLDLDYRSLRFLSNEEVEKLSAVQPATIGAASRISGVTPSSLIQLFKFVKRKKVLQNEKIIVESEEELQHWNDKTPVSQL
jgi:tRNA uridine 5-carboxymethylaminomethyl modification enzyme